MRRGDGFTLVEMLVAIAVAALVLVAVQGVVFSMSRASERLSREGAVLHAGRVVFDRLARELHSAYFRSDREASLFSASSEENRVELAFASTASSPAAEGISPGAVRLRYVWSDGELARQESVLQREPAAADEETLATDIAAARLRFYDGRNWSSSWDSGSRGGLPTLVEVELIFRAGEKDFPLRTVIDPILAGGGT